MDEIDSRSRKRLEWNVVNFIVSGTPALIETNDACWPTSIPEWKSKRGWCRFGDIEFQIWYFANEILHIVPRMREMRWQFGAVLPEEVKLNLSEPELEYFSKYTILSQEVIVRFGDLCFLKKKILLARSGRRGRWDVFVVLFNNKLHQKVQQKPGELHEGHWYWPHIRHGSSQVTICWGSNVLLQCVSSNYLSLIIRFEWGRIMGRWKQLTARWFCWRLAVNITCPGGDINYFDGFDSNCWLIFQIPRHLCEQLIMQGILEHVTSWCCTSRTGFAWLNRQGILVTMWCLVHSQESLLFTKNWVWVKVGVFSHIE